MTTTKPRISECEIAQRGFAEIQSVSEDDLTTRSELVVTIPEAGQVPIDLVYRCADSTNEYFGGVEAKVSLNRDLVAQIRRLRGLVNERWVIYCEPRHRTAALENYESWLDREGVGRVIVCGETARLAHIGLFNPDADTRLIAAAFHSHDGSLDAKAGSAAAKRMTAEKCQWEPLRKYLVARFDPNKPDVGSIWTWIKVEVPEMKRFTCAQARKAVNRGDALGVDYFVKSGQTIFFAKELSRNGGRA